MRADSCLARLTAALRGSVLTGSAALLLLAATGAAQAQSGMEGFASSYQLYSGQRSATAPARARPANSWGGSGWQPGAASVYPPSYGGPRPSVDVGAGYGGTARVVGAGAGGSATAPRGTITVSTSASTYPASSYAGGDVVLPPGAVGAAPARGGATRTAAVAPGAGYDVENPYDEDGPPLPIHRSASGGKGVDPKYNKQLVRYSSADPPGTIIVDTGARYLYLVQGNGTALRYGIGVGRDGFAWSGTQRVSNKREWPEWRPPAEMIARRPDLPRVMEGGPENPLGARALYLGDTLYRIHGTNEPETIGQAVSSGCIRMRNEDVTDLYNRVNVGALVRVI